MNNDDIGIVEYGKEVTVSEKSWKQWLAVIPVGAVVAFGRYAPERYRGVLILGSLAITLLLLWYWGERTVWVRERNSEKKRRGEDG